MTSLDSTSVLLSCISHTHSYISGPGSPSMSPVPASHLDRYVWLRFTGISHRGERSWERRLITVSEVKQRRNEDTEGRGW